MRTQAMDIRPQEILTKDSVTITVDAVIYYRIRDPVKAVCNVSNFSKSAYFLALTTLRTVLGNFTLTDVLTRREEIADMVEHHIDQTGDKWGLDVSLITTV